MAKSYRAPRRRRRSSRRYHTPPPEQDQESLLDQFAESCLNALLGLARWMVRPFTRLWSSPKSSPPVHQRRGGTGTPVAPAVHPAPGRAGQPGTFPKAPPPPLHPSPSRTAAIRAPADPDEPLPYRRVDHLLSQGERAFWNPLFRAVRGRYRLFCKVRLADIVRCPDRHREGEKQFRSIKGYHVDFVICDPKTTRPLLVVELDDRSHRSERQRELDAFKDRVLRDAGLPIHRVPAQQAYDPIEIAQNIERLLVNPEK
jgi:hypothetical protein